MMEIGSIFEIDPFILFDEPKVSHVCFPFMRFGQYNMELFNTGRFVIETLLITLKEKNGVKRVFIPSINCSSVREAAERAELEVELYPVKSDLSVSKETITLLDLKKNDVLYVVQFFGRTYSSKFISSSEQIKNQGMIVVEDISLSLLSCNRNHIGFGDYLTGSIRKWLPVPDSGFIALEKSLGGIKKYSVGNDYTLYYLSAQIMKSCYLQNSSFDKEVFFNYSSRGMEALFYDYTIREMSEISHRILLATDIQGVINKRIENYDFLFSLLNKMNGLKLMVQRNEGMLPVGMILTTENRDELFNYLISNGIYCDIHWRPSSSTEEFEGSKLQSNHCLTIPCDHRYGKEHMLYIAEKIDRYFKGYGYVC